MRLIKRAGKALGVAEHWHKTYYDTANKKWRCDDRKRIIYENLVALGEAPNADDIDRVIGNTSWTSTRCNECGTPDADSVLMLGEEPDYESATVYICAPCLFGASQYMQEVLEDED